VVFIHNDYRAILRARIEANRHIRGYQAQLAKAAGCQRSVLSQVLRGALEITRDQAGGLCQFWHFSDQETEFFLCLVDLVRCKNSGLETFLKKKISLLRADHADLSKKLTKEKLGEQEAQLFYYSSWIPAAIHILLSIPGFDQAEKIAKRLGLPVKLVQKNLGRLGDIGVAKLNGTKWEIQKRDLNLPHTSALREIHHINWRQRAIIDVQKQTEDSIHYSSVFSMNLKDAEWLKAQISKLLVDAKQRVVESENEEEIFCLGCDLFRL